MYILTCVHKEGGPVEARIQHGVSSSMALHLMFLTQRLSLSVSRLSTSTCLCCTGSRRTGV